mmetsp:Transcript_27757/g.51653  ORF Transcript_27757/g.51653 Transcript_27757/m.51653 type:complete len:359 (-) Transcript_27757:835-1911(-)
MTFSARLDAVCLSLGQSPQREEVLSRWDVVDHTCTDTKRRHSLKRKSCAFSHTAYAFRKTPILLFATTKLPLCCVQSVGVSTSSLLKSSHKSQNPSQQTISCQLSLFNLTAPCSILTSVTDPGQSFHQESKISLPLVLVARVTASLVPHGIPSLAYEVDASHTAAAQKHGASDADADDRGRRQPRRIRQRRRKSLDVRQPVLGLLGRRTTDDAQALLGADPRLEEPELVPERAVVDGLLERRRHVLPHVLPREGIVGRVVVPHLDLDLELVLLAGVAGAVSLGLGDGGGTREHGVAGRDGRRAVGADEDHVPGRLEDDGGGSGSGGSGAGGGTPASGSGVGAVVGLDGTAHAPRGGAS